MATLLLVAKAARSGSVGVFAGDVWNTNPLCGVFVGEPIMVGKEDGAVRLVATRGGVPKVLLTEKEKTTIISFSEFE